MQEKSSRRTETFCGTLEYMAPEMMQARGYSYSVDWFSFGILLFEMLSGKNPLKNERQECASPDAVPMRMVQILQSENQLLKKYEGTSVFSPQAFDLLEKLLRYDPEYRIGCRELGALEIKQHPFFSNVDWDLIERKGMVAPFVPEFKNEVDVSYFEDEFTNMPLEQSPTDPRFERLYADQMNLPSFTYVNEPTVQQSEATPSYADIARNDSIARTPQPEDSKLNLSTK